MFLTVIFDVTRKYLVSLLVVFFVREAEEFVTEGHLVEEFAELLMHKHDLVVFSFV